jgi:hypothetical protein
MNSYVIESIIFFILSVIGMWGIFEKAGEKGWKVLVPFYNWYVWLQIIKKLCGGISSCLFPSSMFS